jgi:hypothetical protein
MFADGQDWAQATGDAARLTKMAKSGHTIRCASNAVTNLPYLIAG